jgi:hypothetical protein
MRRAEEMVNSCEFGADKCKRVPTGLQWTTARSEQIANVREADQKKLLLTHGQSELSRIPSRA